MKEKYIAVIDKGTTNLKAVLFDMKGGEVRSVSKPCGRLLSSQPGWCEQDMLLMWEKTGEALRELLGGSIGAADIAAVSVTGHGSGIFPIDKKGAPVRKGILSLDTRAGSLVETWEENGLAAWFFDRMQAELLPCYPVSLLSWLKIYEPENYRKIDQIFFVKDWIKYKLTGRGSTDYTDIGPSCLLDIETMQYCKELFDKFDISEMKEALPEIVPSYQIAGYVTPEAAGQTGLLEGTPVFSGVHDMMACPFGIGTIDERELVCVVGTWGMNFKSSRQRSGTFSFPHVLPGYFLTGRLDGNSGSVQERMLKMLVSENENEQEGKGLYEYAAEQSRKAKDTNLVFQPYLFGALYDSEACGGFYGIRDWHEKKDFIKAVYEGIVFGHYANIRTIEGYEKFNVLWLTGGGARSDYLAQMFADITGIEVRTAAVDNVTARGAALSTLVGLGICSTYEEACILVRTEKMFLPDMRKYEFYQKKYELFRQITESMGTIWRNMGKLRV